MKIAFDIACLVVGAVGLYLVLSHEWRMRKLQEEREGLIDGWDKLRHLSRPGPIFVVLMTAASPTKIRSVATWTHGKSEEEAVGIGYKRANEMWPEKDGYHDYICRAEAIPQEIIDAAATKIPVKPEHGTEGDDDHPA